MGSPVLVLLVAAMPGRRLSTAVVVAACATMLFTAWAQVLGAGAMAFGSCSPATAGHIARHMGTLVVIAALFVVGALTGATVARAVGSLAATALVLVLLRRSGSELRPRWRPSILSKALRVGLVAQLGYLVAALAQRADQLLVLRFAGPQDAGRYSVALTLSHLVAYGAVAVSTVSFARAAYAPDGEWQPTLALMARRSLAAGVLASAGFVILMPPAIPLLFGWEFGPAVGPALLLLPGAVAGGCSGCCAGAPSREVGSVAGEVLLLRPATVHQHGVHTHQLDAPGPAPFQQRPPAVPGRRAADGDTGETGVERDRGRPVEDLVDDPRVTIEHPPGRESPGRDRRSLRPVWPKPGRPDHGYISAHYGTESGSASRCVDGHRERPTVGHRILLGGGWSVTQTIVRGMLRVVDPNSTSTGTY